MVKTRHRVDPDDGQFNEFMSLQSRSTRTRQSAKHDTNGFDTSYTDGQGKSPGSPPDYRERRLRTRRHVQIVDEDSSDSDASPPDYRPSRKRIPLRKRQPSPEEERYPDRRSRRSRQQPIQLEEDASEDEEEVHAEPMERPRRFRRSSPAELQDEEPMALPRKGRRRLIEAVEDDTEEDDEEEVSAPTRRLKRFTSSRSPRAKAGTSSGRLDCDLDSGSIRRSTRQKKLLYGTFNQNLIEKHVMLMGEDGEELDEDDRRGEGMVRRRKRKNSEVEPVNEEDNLDMYSRVKRTRRQVKRDMYGIPLNEEDDQQEESGTASDTSEEEEDEGNEEEEDKNEGRQYYLRQHKPRTNLYEAPPIEPQRTRSRGIFRNDTPPRTFKRTTTYRSPAHKSPRFRSQKQGVKKPASAEKKPVEKKKIVEKKKSEPTRRRAAFHGSSSTSSSSSSDSDDERRFQRRKTKSMARNRNRCLPMNFTGEEVNKGVLRDRTKVGTSLADVDPMSVDRSVTFDSVGGLGKHIRSLKEMIVFPLLYPEVFERFKISPPRGVLFYGPPGTGKTLVARALANECSTSERKVAFFMRKGADCLSKWVGESERQLRLLFDQAYQMRPSIIFFDEIDGLAPVRSSRQDQIHSSIVSTLLALMDGLDNRGEIVVIGATNRLDSIDPALRRPGRFDREFLFPLPTVEARKQILQIHTKEWNPKLCDNFLLELAENCVGYCGADLKALCTEGALHALRRRYPQIYTSEDKLELDVSAIRINARDFHKAMQTIVPASQRSVTSPGRALDRMIKPLLSNVFQMVLYKLQSIFPTAITMSNSLDAPATADSASTQGMELCSDDDDGDDDSHPIYEATGRNGRKKRNGGSNGDASVPRSFLNFTQSASQHPFTYRPRLLLAGERGQGQSTHLGPAVLHQLERLPVHVLDLPALYAVSAHTPEEACAQIFREARRTSPSILYMPHIGEWWEVIHHTLQATFISLLYDLDPTMPVLLVATCESKYGELPSQVKGMFCHEEVIAMENPSESERREFFEDLLLNQLKKPPSTRKQAAARVLEVLPKAKPAEPRKLTEAELKRVQKQEEKHLRELRLFLRDTLNKLGRDRKFGIFAKPVDTDDVPDYYDIIKNPMDLSSMMTKIDLHQYDAVKQFLDDINLICSNALEYNPDRDPSDRAIRHRACALRDTCNALIEAELDPEFEKLCEEIREARARRGETAASSVPTFYYTKPIHSPRVGSLSLSPSKYPSRYSRRTRGMDTEETNHDVPQDRDRSVQEQPQDNRPKIRAIVKKVAIRAKFPKSRSPWCRPSKKRFKKVIIYVDEFGNQVPPPGGAGGAGGDENRADDGKADTEQEVTLKNKPDKDEPKQEDDDAATQASSEATIVEDLEPNEEKENKPVINTQNSPRRSQPSSPNVTPPSLRPATRSGRSPSSSGKFTRSTSPRSLSPRGARGDRPSETPRRSAQDTSPRAFLVTEDNLPRSLSPTVRLRRSSRSSVQEAMDTSPSRPADQHLSEGSSHTNPGPSPKSNPASPSIAVATPNSPPSTPPQRSPSAPSTSATTPHNPETSAPSGEPQASVKEGSTEDTTEKDQEEKASPQVRMTRSRSQVPAAVEALAKRVLETETPQTVIVDDDTLCFLLAKVVNVTNNATIEQLEKLYCHLSQAIFTHRQNIDKTELVQELGMIISRFAAHNHSR